MSGSTFKHFDYLIDHDAELESALGLVDLSKNINRWRCSGMEYPGEALVGCRKIVETALRKLADPLPYQMKFLEVIDYAEDEGLLDRPMALKCHEIRKKGNEGAHEMSVPAIDAQMTLDLLDDFLRWCAEKNQIIPPLSNREACADDSIFIVKPASEVRDMARRAKLASALSDNSDIERKAQEAKFQIEAFDNSAKSDLQKMEELIKQAEEIGASASARQDEATLTAQRSLFDGLQSQIESLKSKKQSVSSHFDDVNSEIKEIMSEHDFVQKLLRGDKRATEKQLEVMAFPKGSHSTTNILQIAGGAGTGKTLCLLAKIISEIDNQGQDSLFETPKKKALFICFNKGLAKYVKDILSTYEGSLPDIEVVHYDLFVNQLVRSKPKKEFAHLEPYAKDVRYAGARIIYGFDEEYKNMLKMAQATVAKRYPDRVNEYYFSSSDKTELDWLKDELLWIEARFEDEYDAAQKYPNAVRVGRGTKHVPREVVRRIILEIWVELNKLLKAKGRYTIEQATKRLMKSSQLPAYDAIAIDEVQDFSLLSIKLLLRFRRDENTRVFISGDENQKIYQRDFTWKELDKGLTGHTITLSTNMRNTPAIRSFSDRLLGVDCPYEAARTCVHIKNGEDDEVRELLKELTSRGDNKTTALISNKKSWECILDAKNVAKANDDSEGITKPGLYLLGDLMGKGLEFDNVVVDYSREISEDEEEEKRLRYVHFTRARKRLYIRYKGTPPKLLSKYYADFLERG